MMKNLLLIAALVSATACTKKDGDAGGSGATAATGACADAIGKAVAAMTDKVKGRMGGNEMANPMVERMEKLRGALVTRCTTDKWPDAVIKCFETAASRGDMKKCQDPLTEDQKMALEADVTKLMLGGGGGRHHGSGGGSGHGGDDDKPAGSAAGSAAAGSAAPAGSAAAGSAAAGGW